MLWFFFVFLLEFNFVFSHESTYKHACIVGRNLDKIILLGAQHIKEKGSFFNARAGSGQQAYDVTYVLLNPRDRLHLLRGKTAKKYFSRELLAYFKGSLNVSEGLSQASKFWSTLIDEKGEICSNYGYYVFHQRIPEEGNITQYEWVIKNLEKNLDSRKAFININQPYHKNFKNLDFPCTIGMQFYVEDDYLCCTVSSRSTDIYTGLPYDMGFFAFITELVYKDLKLRLPEDKAKNLKLGHVAMKTNFTQIYDKTRGAVLSLLEENNSEFFCSDKVELMPEIENAQATLADIYNGTCDTEVMKWIYANAEFK